jgi:uncharacterized protein (TIGR02231 family)
MKRLIAWTVAALAWVVATGCTPAPAPKAPPSPRAVAKPKKPPAVFALASEVSDEPRDPTAVSSRITKVTVYSDRALVTRGATVAVTTKPAVHRFRQLPGWVDEGSIRAATSAGKILDVSVQRDFLAHASDQGFRRAEKAHRALERRMQALDDELAILDAQREHVGSIKVFSLEKLETDAAAHDIDISSYGQVIDFVSDRLRSTAKARRGLKEKREELAPKVAASKRKLEELKRLTTLEQTTVAVTLIGKTAGKADLALTYATPGATWEPVHEIRARSDHPGSIALTSYAVVTQTTGEDWRHAKLSFSTQSSSDAEQIPELEMLALGKPVETSRSISRTTTFSQARQKYEEQNRHWNQLNQAPSKTQAEIRRFEKSYATNLEYFEQVQSRTVQLFHGLQRRGTTAHFVALEPGLARSDGVPVRLPIGGATLPAKEKIIAAPEQSLNAAVTLGMENNTQPLLPGRVSRYFDGAFLGLTDTDFVAPGEHFSLFFRVADQVKLTRKLDRKKSSLTRGSKNRMQLSFLTTVKNLSKRPVSLALAERVPVSENSDIRVTHVKIAPSETPNNEGIVRFALTLAPGERREIRIGYQVDYPSSLVLDVKRRRRAAPAPAPGMPAPKPKRDFEDQLPELEQML